MFEGTEEIQLNSVVSASSVTKPTSTLQRRETPAKRLLEHEVKTRLDVLRELGKEKEIKLQDGVDKLKEGEEIHTCFHGDTDGRK